MIHENILAIETVRRQNVEEITTIRSSIAASQRSTGQELIGSCGCRIFWSFSDPANRAKDC